MHVYAIYTVQEYAPYGIRKGSLIKARHHDIIGIVIDTERWSDGEDLYIYWTSGEISWCISEAVELLA